MPQLMFQPILDIHFSVQVLKNESTDQSFNHCVNVLQPKY